MKVNVIVAIQTDGGIGNKGDQPYSFKEDFANFQSLTMGGTVIMGRKTWEAIPENFRPLKGRTNIVVTNNAEYPLPQGVILAPSYEKAKELAKTHNPDGQIWNIGGGSLYTQAIHDTDTSKLFITRILGEKLCDVFFPHQHHKYFKKTKSQPPINSKNRFDGQEYSFVFEEWECV